MATQSDTESASRSIPTESNSSPSDGHKPDSDHNVSGEDSELMDVDEEVPSEAGKSRLASSIDFDLNNDKCRYRTKLKRPRASETSLWAEAEHFKLYSAKA